MHFSNKVEHKVVYAVSNGYVVDDLGCPLNPQTTPISAFLQEPCLLAVVRRVRRRRCAVSCDGQVVFGGCGDDFEDQTWRHRHDHTVDSRVLVAPGRWHCVDENGVLQQEPQIKIFHTQAYCLQWPWLGPLFVAF